MRDDKGQDRPRVDGRKIERVDVAAPPQTGLDTRLDRTPDPPGTIVVELREDRLRRLLNRLPELVVKERRQGSRGGKKLEAVEETLQDALDEYDAEDDADEDTQPSMLDRAVDDVVDEDASEEAWLRTKLDALDTEIEELESRREELKEELG
jgi:hypothetical protein